MLQEIRIMHTSVLLLLIEVLEYLHATVDHPEVMVHDSLIGGKNHLLLTMVNLHSSETCGCGGEEDYKDLPVRHTRGAGHDLPFSGEHFLIWQSADQDKQLGLCLMVV